MNNKQNHTGPNYVTYIPKIHLNPNITNHIINIHITNTILKAFRGSEKFEVGDLAEAFYYTIPLPQSYLTHQSQGPKAI